MAKQNASAMKQIMVTHKGWSNNIVTVPKTRKASQKKVKTISSRHQSFMSWLIEATSPCPNLPTSTLFPQYEQNSLSSGIGLLQEGQARISHLIIGPLKL
jgi:hypothetical protein